MASIFNDRNPRNLDELIKLNELYDNLEDLLFINDSPYSDKQTIYNISIIENIKDILVSLSKMPKFKGQGQQTSVLVKNIRRLLVKYMFDSKPTYHSYISEEDKLSFFLFINHFYVKNKLDQFINKQDEEDKENFNQVDMNEYQVFILHIPDELRLAEEIEYLKEINISLDKKKNVKIEIGEIENGEIGEIGEMEKVETDEDKLLGELYSMLNMLKTTTMNNLQFFYYFIVDLQNLLYKNSYEKYTKTTDCINIVDNIMKILLSNIQNLPSNSNNDEILDKIKKHIENISSAVERYYNIDDRDVHFDNIDHIDYKAVNAPIDTPVHDISDHEDIFRNQDFDNYPEQEQIILTEEQYDYLENLGVMRNDIQISNIGFILELLENN